MNVQTLKWCKQLGVMADWNLIYGFPGETPADYENNLHLAAMLTHLDPPSGCGPIRLDRFSPNFDRAGEMGLINVRPAHFYRFIYPFDQDTLSDLVYYFDFDYRQDIDQGGLVPAIEQIVCHWKSRADKLEVERVDDTLIIRDSRPVATWREMTISGIAARIYEYCDRAQTLTRIMEVMRQFEPDITEELVAHVLNDFIRKKLMAQDGNRYLSLGVFTYTTEFERQDQATPDARSRTLMRQAFASDFTQIQPASVAKNA